MRISAIKGYKVVGVDFFALVNNHVFDDKEIRLKITINTLNSAGVCYVGVDNTPNEASKPFVFDCDGKKIGVLCLC